MIGPETKVFTTLGYRAARQLQGRVYYGVTWADRVTLTPLTVREGAPAELVVITLDDTSVVQVGLDAALIARDGQLVRATDVEPGLSLMPFYTRRRKKLVEYFEPGDYFLGGLATADKEAWRSLLRMVAEWKFGRRLEDGEHTKRNGSLDDYSPEHITLRRVRKVDPKSLIKNSLWYKLQQAAAVAESYKELRGPGRPPTSNVLRPPKNHKVVDVTRGHCFAEGSRVYVIESSVVTPLPIEQLALEDGAGRYVLGYDEQRKIIRKTLVKRAWLTKPAAPVLRVPLSNGAVLRVTPEHELLTPEGGFIQAKKLNKAARVVSVPSGFNLRERSVLTHHNPGTLWLADWHVADREPARIFDVETELGNLIVDGVVCHNSTAPLSIDGMGSGNFSAGGVFITSDPR